MIQANNDVLDFWNGDGTYRFFGYSSDGVRLKRGLLGRLRSSGVKTTQQILDAVYSQNVIMPTEVNNDRIISELERLGAALPNDKILRFNPVTDDGERKYIVRVDNASSSY